MKSLMEIIFVFLGTFALFLSMYEGIGDWRARSICFFGAFGILLYALKRLGDELFRKLFFIATVILIVVMIFMIFQ